MPPTRTAGAMPEISASRPKSRARPFRRSKPKSRERALATPEPDKESNKSKTFMQLPLELKLQIVEYIPTRDIPNIRMISESWAAAGAPSMFRNGFTVRPHLDDMDRLCEVCTNPEIAKGIRHIEFFAGDMDEELLANAIAREQQRLIYATGGQLSKVWKQIDAIFDQTRFQKHCNAAILDRCFPLLPNLHSLKVTSLECPVRGIETPFCILWATLEEEFDADNEELSHFLHPETSIERYSSILWSAKLCKSITKIDLDSFPIDYFRDHRQLHFPIPRPYDKALTPGPRLRESLSHITNLRISIIGMGEPHPYIPKIGRKMAEFLGCFKNLHSLDLSYEEADDESDECLSGFEDSFYRLKFPHLHSFRTAGCDSTEESLGKFLFAHKRTLRNLHIGEAGCTPLEKTWKDVLTDLRDYMSLQKFELYDPDYEGRIYDANWKSVVPDVKEKIKDAKLLELYVLRKCPWPMAESNPREGGWKRKFGAEDMKLLDLGEEELRDLLGEEWETDGESEDGDNVDMEDEDDSEDGGEDYFSVDEDHDFIDDTNPAAVDGDWEDMEVDGDEVVE
ncbi:hypothetical protein BKA65DRAFT_536447 [Rhexocercosporidium sp. MPI-PUGE-AT-0058]|nr:hypothetical protein BKA65DRAFT_536447 [Rhexocercosporidium sp. MPI-PUGE-AT-0058]